MPPSGSGRGSSSSASNMPARSPTVRTQTSQADVSTSKAGNLVWRGGPANSGAASTSQVGMSASSAKTKTQLNPSAVAWAPPPASMVVAAGPVAPATPATVGTSKAGNRVWTNRSTQKSVNVTIAKKIPSTNRIIPKGNSGSESTPTATATDRSSSAPLQRSVGTSKAGNLVWTKAGSKPTSETGSHSQSQPSGATSTLSGARAEAAAAVRDPVNVRSLSGSSIPGSSKQRGSSNVNLAITSRVVGAASLSATTARGPSPAAPSARPFERRPPRPPRPPSFASMGAESSKTGNLVWVNSATTGGSGGAAPRTGTAKPRVVPSSHRGRSPASVSSTVASQSAARRQQTLTSATANASQQPTARYSGSAHRQLKSESRAGAPGGRARAPTSDSSSNKTRAAGQVARYSGARTGRGGQLVAGCGRGATSQGRGSSMARGYIRKGVGRGLASWGRGIGWLPRGGRGMIPSHHRRLYPSPFFGMNLRYGAMAQAPFGYGYPAMNWGSRWAPWRGDRADWSRRDALRGNRSSRPRKSKFKNRTLIRVRSMILPQSASVAPFAINRRKSLLRTRSALIMAAKKKIAGSSSTPEMFVRSGKHGMAIRRVNSMDLAARRRAAAASLASRSAVTGVKHKVTATGPISLSTTPATAGVTVASRERSLVSHAARKGKPAAVTQPAATCAVTPRKAKLLKKIRDRSNVAGVSRRKAAAAMVVADARAKRARVVGRNMTLYRGKDGAGQVTVSGVSDHSTRTAKGSPPLKKQKRIKTEQCLFFCKFGKCSKSDEECRFIHDKSKVAVCRAFLKGECTKGEGCLLTHAIQTEKMPVCIYFERGMCFTPNCPYLHVKVSKKAAICPNFLKGYCPDGTACRLKHELGDHRKRKTRDATDEREQGGEESGGPRRSSNTTSASETGSSTQLGDGAPKCCPLHSRRRMGMARGSWRGGASGIHWHPLLPQQFARMFEEGSRGCPDPPPPLLTFFSRLVCLCLFALVRAAIGVWKVDNQRRHSCVAYRLWVLVRVCFHTQHGWRITNTLLCFRF
ncbi:unnamed protein product [Sphacelaria rigidula]